MEPSNQIFEISKILIGCEIHAVPRGSCLNCKKNMGLQDNLAQRVEEIEKSNSIREVEILHFKCCELTSPPVRINELFSNKAIKLNHKFYNTNKSTFWKDKITQIMLPE